MCLETWQVRSLGSHTATHFVGRGLMQLYSSRQHTTGVVEMFAELADATLVLLTRRQVPERIVEKWIHEVVMPLVSELLQLPRTDQARVIDMWQTRLGQAMDVLPQTLYRLFPWMLAWEEHDLDQARALARELRALTAGQEALSVVL